MRLFFSFHFLFKLVPSVPFYFFFALGLLCPFRYHVMLFTLRRSEEENIKRFHHCMSTAKLYSLPSGHPTTVLMLFAPQLPSAAELIYLNTLQNMLDLQLNSYLRQKPLAVDLGSFC